MLAYLFVVLAVLLRLVAGTGAFATLWDVMVWYRDAAGVDGFVGTRDPAVQPLRLSDDDLGDLVAFLRALDGTSIPSSLLVAPALPP
mgnify:CR=1 FL=1